MKKLLKALAPIACLGLASCAVITGEPNQTEMLVANHTGATISVGYEQTPENGPHGNYAVTQSVLPDETIRFSGHDGDTLVIERDGRPPLTLVFARRSQTVKIVDSVDGADAVIRKGYTDPDRR